MINYNLIGLKYNLNRTPDIRIVDKLVELLEVDKKSIICDIGAGTGNYTSELANIGFVLDAIEPSIQMINQSKPNKNVTWHKLKVEEMNINEKYDGAISTLAIHHFSDIEKSFKNISRALKKDVNFIIFCADPRKIDEHCWYKSYFNDLIEKAKESYLPLEILLDKLEKCFGSLPLVEPFRIPNDITDGFFYAGWQAPEQYLKEEFRKSISVFSKAPKGLVEKSIERLEKDLKAGIWDLKFGKVRDLKSYNGGYFFVRIKNRE